MPSNSSGHAPLLLPHPAGNAGPLAGVSALGSVHQWTCKLLGCLVVMKRHFKQVMLARWLDYRGEESRQALLWAFLNARFQTGLRNLLDGAILETGEPRKGGMPHSIYLPRMAAPPAPCYASNAADQSLSCRPAAGRGQRGGEVQLRG